VEIPVAPRERLQRNARLVTRSPVVIWAPASASPHSSKIWRNIVTLGRWKSDDPRRAACALCIDGGTCRVTRSSL
jgi:hypothetical protein